MPKYPENNSIENLRHSLAHLLAAAVLKIFPEAKLGIGPVIENGFYYDFLLPRPLSAEDLGKIEEKMREFISQSLPVTGKKITSAEASKIFKNQPFKLELIRELVKEKKPITIYSTGDIFTDLCAGGHVKNTKEIKPEAFKLTKVAGAYWKGDEKNPQLQRIYGLAFETQKELDDYLKLQEEAEKRDHRKIGKNLDLFVFSDLIGKGLPLFTSKGATIRRELERFTVEEEIKRGYEHVVTPPLAKVDLYRTSGHYPYYKNTMYPPMKIDEEELILRPMTCPHHFMLYKARLRSYKELPIKFAELSPQFRYEKSGELSGLSRVRMFCLADAHIFAKVDQAKEVISGVLSLIEYVNTVFGLRKEKDYRYRLSLGDRKDDKKYYKDDDSWNKAEEILRELLKERKEPFFEAPGEAAFYGPKIDIQMKNAYGNEETAFTVQYDFVMPKRFDLKYIDAGGKEKQPIVIHRSSIGAVERTMAFLLEHFAGALPLWLAPVQAEIINVGAGQKKYSQEIWQLLKNRGIRTALSDENLTVSKRIREAELQKIPYILVVGEKEKKNGTVNVRHYRRGQEGEIKIEKLLEKITQEIAAKVI